MINELGITEIIDQAIEQDLDKRHLSIGECVKAMILNGLGFTGRPLYLTPDFFRTKPLDLLIKEGINHEYLNDNTLGRAMDKLYETGVNELFALISSNAFHALELTPEFSHLDSTSFSVYGKDYTPRLNHKESELSTIEITEGYSKDHRPDLLQFMLNLIVDNRAGIPMAMEPLSGNSSDKKTFVETVESHIDNLKNTTTRRVIMDSALYSEENIKKDAFKSLYWVSRVPETIKEAKTQIALSIPDTMRIVNHNTKEETNSSSFLVNNKDSSYAYRCSISTYAGIKQQWVIVYSKEAKKRAKKSVVRQTDKQNTKEIKWLKKFQKESFACESDMNKALNVFRKKLRVIEIQKCTTIKTGHYNRVGKPSKEQKEKGYDYYTYSARLTISSSLQTFYEKLHQKSFFILATNDLLISPEEIIANYKNQHRVERGFRFLKGKEFLTDAIYIKSPERIEALLFVMTLCLMVYASLEYRIRKELRLQEKTVSDQKGKPTSKPTARWIFHCFAGIELLIINLKEQIMMNINEMHKLILMLLGQRYLDIYLIRDGV
jgi:transposase